ncbi:MAG: creatininase family protein [Bacillota bacterium]
MIRRENQIKYMTWPKIRERIDSGYDTIIMVLASTEQHGHHLAECTDEVIGLGIACGLAERLENALVAPPIIPGLSEHHLAFPGSLTLRKETFRGMVEDYVDSYIRHGFKRFVFIASHGGNMKITEEITNELSAKYPERGFLNTLSLNYLREVTTRFEEEYNLPSGSCGGHACAFETSVMLYLEPELVDMEVAKAGYVGAQEEEFLDSMFKNGIKGVSEIGVIGDPTYARAELGEKFYTEILDELTRLCKEII